MPLLSRPAVIAQRLAMLMFAILIISALLVAPIARAQQFQYPDACYVCKKMGMLVSDCFYPPQSGLGHMNCSITPIFLNVICAVDGPVCEYDCFGPGCDGGGGPAGGGGGGGGSDCGGGGYCDSSCFTCGGSYY